eukprot:TRINITY_DN9303_c0_g2_i1.p1 TRINITY_DN9303_c0_g2~~TRINITY_DN9303_c0_g2_i1.p1  ORF type:complete len:109 (-),score=7.38 TRINITY_DN9303_c0_g2_i1:22-348(-)
MNAMIVMNANGSASLIMTIQTTVHLSVQNIQRKWKTKLEQFVKAPPYFLKNVQRHSRNCQKKQGHHVIWRPFSEIIDTSKREESSVKVQISSAMNLVVHFISNGSLLE